MKNKKEILSLADASIMCGVSQQSMRNWVNREGAPNQLKGGRGKNWEFVKEDLLLWYSANKSNKAANESFDEARTRKAVADATLAEIDVDIKKALLIKVEDVATTVEKEYTAIRAKLLTIPSKVAPIIFQETDTLEQIQTLLENEINEVLTELSSYK